MGLRFARPLQQNQNLLTQMIEVLLVATLFLGITIDYLLIKWITEDQVEI